MDQKIAANNQDLETLPEMVELTKELKKMNKELRKNNSVHFIIFKALNNIRLEKIHQTAF